MSVRKVCDELELTFGRCDSDARALLKKRVSRNLQKSDWKMHWIM